MVLYQESRYGNPVIYDLHLVYTGLRIRKWRIRHGRRYGKLSAGFHWTRYCMAVYSRLAGATGERQLQQLPDWLRKRTWLVHLVFCMVLQKLQRTVQRSGEVWLAVLQQQQPIPSLVFNLLCAPCFAAMGAIKREMNNAKWFWFAIGYQTILAYAVSLVVYQIGHLFEGGSFSIGTVAAFLVIALLGYLLFRPYKESNTLKVKVKATIS